MPHMFDAPLSPGTNQALGHLQTSVDEFLKILDHAIAAAKQA